MSHFLTVAMAAQHRSAQPAGDFQIRRAQALCAGSPTLQANLEGFLRTDPTYAQMAEYLKQLKASLAESLVASLVVNFTVR